MTEQGDRPQRPTDPSGRNDRDEQRRMPAMERYWHEMHTEIAPLMLVSDARSLVGLYFPGHRHVAERSPQGRFVTEDELGDHPVLAMARTQLEDYFAGRRREFDLPLDPDGTAFQHRVWAALRDIPYATTHSYGQVAEAIGRRGAARAVGMANGRNPLSIIVPCHRVIGSNGKLIGYAGGQANKRALLDLERQHAGTAR